jgi:hypothetical protein
LSFTNYGDIGLLCVELKGKGRTYYFNFGITKNRRDATICPSRTTLAIISHDKTTISYNAWQYVKMLQ